jgi:TIGR03009 family protein
MTFRATFLSAFILGICSLVSVSIVVAQTAPPVNGAAVANAAPIQTQNQPLAPPSFMPLSPADDANLNQLLGDWEKANSSIKTFKCTFTRLEYDPSTVGGNPNQASAVSNGELKYAPPDKGMFKVEKRTNYVPDLKTGKIVEQPVDPMEWWTCDGKSMYEVTMRDNQMLVIEKPLPPEMHGKAITEGPLPFVFGARADSLKRRYYMRVATPTNAAATQVWLEAYPKMQKDAANFSRVMLILNKADLQPSAIQIFNPGANAQNNSRTVIMLDNPSINSTLDAVQNFFTNFARPNPMGAKHVLESDLAPPAITPLQTGNPADNSQASRPKAAIR